MKMPRQARWFDHKGNQFLLLLLVLSFKILSSLTILLWVCVRVLEGHEVLTEVHLVHGIKVSVLMNVEPGVLARPQIFQSPDQV